MKISDAKRGSSPVSARSWQTVLVPGQCRDLAGRKGGPQIALAERASCRYRIDDVAIGYAFLVSASSHRWSPIRGAAFLCTLTRLRGLARTSFRLVRITFSSSPRAVMDYQGYCGCRWPLQVIVILTSAQAVGGNVRPIAALRRRTRNHSSDYRSVPVSSIMLLAVKRSLIRLSPDSG